MMRKAEFSALKTDTATIKFEYKGYSYRAEDDPIHEMTYNITYDLISKIRIQ